MTHFLRIVVSLITFVLLTACAAPARVQSSFNKSLDFSLYETFNFGSATAIENPDFPDLLGLLFSAATEEQMFSRGYVKSDNPDILINISVDLIDIQKAPRQNGKSPSYGDYYSREHTEYYKYSGRPQARLPETRRTFCDYSEGSIKIDMVDVQLKRTIWEGVSFIRIDERERGFLLNGSGDIADVKRRSTYLYDYSRISDDEISIGYLQKGYILDDVAIMFENSPFRAREQLAWVSESN